MIQVTLLPLSSPEVAKLQKWLRMDEATRLLQIVNSDLTRLEIEMANEIAQSVTFPKHEEYARDKHRQIQILQHFLQTFQHYTKANDYSLLKLETKYE
jgi:hypothetical protein